ncbi:hypothetical protein DKT77_17525 [Meridianimarinicoccus roseus]|jgi:hypothetical protein|uniref:Uncharacterized protein n=1 Tax=Meridianimarinicoccus roseus TaxID=2072018 RepID=A0A2V2LHK7_9RHOB|nr:hypothetical protein [Meridianimarinicoccus roseus]PWR01363.1 hypothetical protein DKT77_17525 [Meridianimarinicoccus roseus]
MILPILGLLVLLWMFLTYKARMRTRNCRWREDRSRDTAEGRYFVCMSCGVQTFRPDNLPPPVCLKPQSEPRR